MKRQKRPTRKERVRANRAQRRAALYTEAGDTISRLRDPKRPWNIEVMPPASSKLPRSSVSVSYSASFEPDVVGTYIVVVKER